MTKLQVEAHETGKSHHTNEISLVQGFQKAFKFWKLLIGYSRTTIIYSHTWLWSGRLIRSQLMRSYEIITNNSWLAVSFWTMEITRPMLTYKWACFEFCVEVWIFFSLNEVFWKFSMQKTLQLSNLEIPNFQKFFKVLGTLAKKVKKKVSAYARNWTLAPMIGQESVLSTRPS